MELTHWRAGDLCASMTAVLGCSSLAACSRVQPRKQQGRTNPSIGRKHKLFCFTTTGKERARADNIKYGGSPRINILLAALQRLSLL